MPRRVAERALGPFIMNRQIANGPVPCTYGRLVSEGGMSMRILIPVADQHASGDMPCPFSCMQAAAEAGLAPRIGYDSAEDQISITDFVEAVSLPATDALGRREAAQLDVAHPSTAGDHWVAMATDA